MKDRQFKSIEEVEEFNKRIKKDKKRNVTDDEYNALDRHLINLYADAMDGDKQAVSKLYLFADSLLKGKQAASAIRSKSGSQKGKAMDRKIILLAIAMRRELINDLDEAEWSLLVDEVVNKAKARGKKKQKIIKVLNKNRQFIENIPLKRA
ncbi:hypothetical protein N9100_02415 [Gammaproteobacteria bacterium]|nr:hypothetical protein [Gammaproteobacteria bacterium]